MRLRASLHCVFSTLMCFLNERCESHHSPRNFVDSSTGRSVYPILKMGGFWVRDRGAVKCTTANLKPFLVAHSCMEFTACCRCLSMVSRERPNSDSDSPVPEIFWHKNRQSASEANPVKISDDTILPGCLICFLQVKEETNSLLPSGKCVPEISLKTHQVVSGATMLPEATLASV